MSADEETPTRPVLRVVKGDPTPEELAVLTAVMAAEGGNGDEPAPAERRGGWNDPARRHRGSLIPGPNAWRAQAW